MGTFIDAMPIGTVIDSMLTPAQMSANYGSGWALCDGSSCVGSKFQSLTGLGAVPDFRGRFKRMKDHGAGVDTHGDPVVGTVRNADLLANHNHQWYATGSTFDSNGNTHGFAQGGVFSGGFLLNANTTHTAPTFTKFGANGNEYTSNAGGTSGELAPYHAVVNYFIKIN